MSKKSLSPEIVSLIHHVELNQSGWWKKAVAQVVRGVLWKSASAMTLAELQAAMKQELGIRLTEEVLTKQLDALVAQGSVSRLPGPNFKLTEKARQELTGDHTKAVQEQEACQVQFLATCETFCPELDGVKVWTEFGKALLSAIHVTGANLFHLLADGNLERDVDWLAEFLSKFDRQHREGLRKVLSAFFAPGNHVCRNQVLRLLTAHFFAEASQLRPETLALIEGEKKVRSIKVVLDTNFIFSVLGLHDNPGDDAALSLIEVAQKAGRNLDVKFYVLPSTLDEAQRVLLNQMHRVERIRTTRAMAQVALTQPLPSVAKKFFDAAAKTPGLTATAFFQPYIDDLRAILRDKGISVLEAHPSVYHQRQDVVDDVLDEQRREESELPDDRRKGYETLLHDAVLWHAVQDRRSADADSPFEVEYWAVSIDWRLISFDRRKRASNKSRLPVVLHPSNLVQLVQFWVPRSKELEESLVDSLRLPLFFQSFDPDDERATIKVLEALSRYENVGDLPEHTLKKVLANRALRGRLKDADASNDEAIALIREELLAEHRDALAQLEATRGTLKHTEDSLVQERKTRKQSDEQREATSKELREAQARAETAEGLAAAASKEHADAKEKLRLASEALEVQRLKNEGLVLAEERRRVRLQYVLSFLLLPAAMGVLFVYFGYRPTVEVLPSLESGWKRWAFVLGVGLLPLALSCVVSQYYVPKRNHLSSWWVSCSAVHVGKKAVLAPIVSVFSAVFQGGAWDWVKAATGFNP
jgi:hypothetical protein